MLVETSGIDESNEEHIKKPIQFSAQSTSKSGLPSIVLDTMPVASHARYTIVSGGFRQFRKGASKKTLERVSDTLVTLKPQLYVFSPTQPDPGAACVTVASRADMLNT